LLSDANVQMLTHKLPWWQKGKDKKMRGI